MLLDSCQFPYANRTKMFAFAFKLHNKVMWLGFSDALSHQLCLFLCAFFLQGWNSRHSNASKSIRFFIGKHWKNIYCSLRTRLSTNVSVSSTFSSIRFGFVGRERKVCLYHQLQAQGPWWSVREWRRQNRDPWQHRLRELHGLCYYHWSRRVVAAGLY